MRTVLSDSEIQYVNMKYYNTFERLFVKESALRCSDELQPVRSLLGDGGGGPVGAQ